MRHQYPLVATYSLSYWSPRFPHACTRTYKYFALVHAPYTLTYMSLPPPACHQPKKTEKLEKTGARRLERTEENLRKLEPVVSRKPRKLKLFFKTKTIQKIQENYNRPRRLEKTRETRESSRKPKTNLLGFAGSGYIAAQAFPVGFAGALHCAAQA